MGRTPLENGEAPRLHGGTKEQQANESGHAESWGV